MTAVDERPKAKRGTSNGNAAGSSKDRRRRKAWLLETYRADRDLLIVEAGPAGAWEQPVVGPVDVRLWVLDVELPFTRVEPACRCYRCGRLLIITDNQEDPRRLTVDRITPGCQGGTYRRANIRPACGKCNSETGGATRSKRAGRR